MWFQQLFRGLTIEDKEHSINRLVNNSTPRSDFFLAVVLSVLMASLGALLNSTVILIGSMLIAPVLYPVLSLALGLVGANQFLIRRSIYTLVKSVILALVAALVMGIFLNDGPIGDIAVIEAMAGGKPSLGYALVAAISGLAAAFALLKPDLNETLPGVAVSVSLVPPLAVAGLALASLDWSLASNALLMFILNVAGVVFSSMMVFALFELGNKKKTESQSTLLQ